MSTYIKPKPVVVTAESPKADRIAATQEKLTTIISNGFNALEVAIAEGTKQIEANPYGLTAAEAKAGSDYDELVRLVTIAGVAAGAAQTPGTVIVAAPAPAEGMQLVVTSEPIPPTPPPTTTP